MEGNEYMKVQYRHFPEDIRKIYKLDEKVTNSGHIYINQKRYVWTKTSGSASLWKTCAQFSTIWLHTDKRHSYIMEAQTRPTTFCVCIGDLGIKYYTEADGQHLINSLCNHYKCTTDWEGKKILRSHIWLAIWLRIRRRINTKICQWSSHTLRPQKKKSPQ